MTTDKQLLGKDGEDLAERYLTQMGWKIIDRNYRHKKSEIDIIAHEGIFLVFVEVKTRTRTDYGHPEDTLGERQAQKIVEGAEEYIFQNQWKGPIRFDIVAITLLTGAAPDIQLFKDAFY